ncbi:MAG: 4'-phosphopantetheinyl transferase superfamily protein, partial [Verrucomicrobiota bacterium]
MTRGIANTDVTANVRAISNEEPWSTPPEDWASSLKGVIHVWYVRPQIREENLAVWARHLSLDELCRAQRFRSPLHQSRFVACRGMLRELLAQYLRRDPERLVLCYGPFGKPELAMSSSRERLHFNLAHCDDVVLFGFCKECELGVDIEQIRPLPEAEEIARRYFSANEFRCWQSLPAGEKLAAFYHCWTRKEAVLKARGWGIGTGLDAFEVSLSPDKAAVVHMES